MEDWGGERERESAQKRSVPRADKGTRIEALPDNGGAGAVRGSRAVRATWEGGAAPRALRGLFRAVGASVRGSSGGDASGFALESAHSDSLVGSGLEGPQGQWRKP